MNELMVSRARWSLLPLIRPPQGAADADGSPTTSAHASPEPSPPRQFLSSPSPSAGGFRSRMRNVRDKIRRRVAQTGDWPPPGAIFGDRYSVSSGIGAMVGAGRGLPGHWSAPPSRKTYPSQRRPPVESFPLKQRSDSDARGPGKKGGIVCSEMDMNAIIAGFREFEKSIRVLHHSPSAAEAAEKPPPGSALPSIVVESADSPTPSAKSSATKKQVSFDERSLGGTSTPPSTSPLPDRKVEAEPQAPKKKQSPKEIEFDEFGQTWDVYGADFDPELLGLAIQRRLDRMMERETQEEEEEEEAGETLSDHHKCQRLRRLWRQLWCLARRHHKCPPTAATASLD